MFWAYQKYSRSFLTRAVFFLTREKKIGVFFRLLGVFLCFWQEPRVLSVSYTWERFVALSCLDVYLPACPEAAPSVTRHGALQTDRQLKPPRRRGSLASREGEVRHKK